MFAGPFGPAAATEVADVDAARGIVPSLAADEAVRLHRAAAGAAIAIDLARAAEPINRARGCFLEPPREAAAAELLAQARTHAGTHPLAVARIVVAAAFDTPDLAPDAQRRAVQALDAARAAGCPTS